MNFNYLRDPNGLSKTLDDAYAQHPPEPTTSGLGDRIRARRQAMEQGQGRETQGQERGHSGRWGGDYGSPINRIELRKDKGPIIDR